MYKETLSTQLPLQAPKISRTPPPAQLWIGEHDILLAETTAYLQKQLCTQNGCAVCVECRLIADHQHHAIMWLYPENRYTLETLEPMMRAMSFALNSHELRFFILQKADLLSPICANSLLKSLEEPPPGYCFILLSQRPETILPTIRSRCIAQSFLETNEASTHPLLSYFMSPISHDPSSFLQELQSLAIADQETLELLDTLLKYWSRQHTDAIINKNRISYNKAHRILTLLQEVLAMPPMPGSSTLFWKNLYLQFHGITK